MRAKPAVVAGRVIARAWVTGAGTGIGRAVAGKLAQSGVTVAVSARTADDLEALVRETERATGTIVPFVLDVTDRAAVGDAASRIERDVGPLDLALFNAGTHAPFDPGKFDADVFRRLVEVNLMGTVHGLEAVVPAMIARGAGHVGVVSSVAGYRGLPTAAAYGATKAALINMCEALYPELAVRGVGLSLINPGFVKTPLTDLNEFPMPFLMEVDAAANALLSGLAAGRFEITFPRRFTWLVKFGRILPYALYLALTRRMVDR